MLTSSTDTRPNLHMKLIQAINLSRCFQTARPISYVLFTVLYPAQVTLLMLYHADKKLMLSSKVNLSQ
jgi:hypothetical protein